MGDKKMDATTTTTTVGTTSTATTPIATTTTCGSNTSERPNKPDIGLNLRVTVTPTDIIASAPQTSSSKNEEEITEDEDKHTSSPGSCYSCGGGGLLFGLPTKATETDTTTTTTGHREYIIVLTVDNHDAAVVGPNATNNNKTTLTICQTQMRFSTFYERFSSPHEFGRNETTASLLPRRGWWFFEDHTYNNHNVARRSSDMRFYLLQLLNASGVDILDSANLRTALDIAPEEVGSQLLHKIANWRRKEEARMAEEQWLKQEAARLAFLEQKRQLRAASVARWKRAQDLDMTQAETRTSLKFNVVEKFVYKHTWFSWGGDANIRDCGNGTRGMVGKSWFHLMRTDYPQIAPFSDMTYELQTAGENGGRQRPLLEMKERFRMFDYMCDLYYIVGDSNNRRRVKAATVHRECQIGFFGENYTITVPSTTTNNSGNGNKQYYSERISSVGQRQYSCVGSFGDLEIRHQRLIAAKINQHFWGTDYTIQIYPNQDCLLLLGICCAIGRIHAAIAAQNSSHSAAAAAAAT